MAEFWSAENCYEAIYELVVCGARKKFPARLMIFAFTGNAFGSILYIERR
jgi:hypothetical protein